MNTAQQIVAKTIKDMRLPPWWRPLSRRRARQRREAYLNYLNHVMPFYGLYDRL